MVDILNQLEEQMKKLDYAGRDDIDNPASLNKVGVLALQGDFKEHIDILKKIGVDGVEVRIIKDLKDVYALIIPGGESTTIITLMLRTGLFHEIKKKCRNGMSIYGTCAGAILLAKEIVNSNLPSLGLIDISIERNAYGRQIESFEAEIEVKEEGIVKGMFIRAPVITKIGKNVEVLAKLNNVVVAARQGRVFVTTFHPELAGNVKMHELFLDTVSPSLL